jgi:hypothetical protein
MPTIPEEPASDDFHTFVPSACARPFGADEQVFFDAQKLASAFHPLNYGQNTPSELKHLASVALKVLGFLSTSASVERAFSVARSVTTDYQMAMTQETVSARVTIQANWRVAHPLLANVLAMGRGGVRRTVSASSGNSPNTRPGAWTSRARCGRHRRPVRNKT